jgi:hypothetical protein
VTTLALRGINCTATTSPGAPTTGTWAVGDLVSDSVGEYWRCTVAGTPGTWVSLGSTGGLSYFTEARNTTNPNTATPAHSLTASGGESNIDLVLIPKGTGAILAAVPDNGTTGGNKRGTRAIDLQMFRTASTHVAAGNNSVITGGQSNRAGGAYAVVCGGFANNAGGDYAAVLGGRNNIANGSDSAVVGSDHIITNSYTFAHGQVALDNGAFVRYFGHGASIQSAGGRQFEERALHLQTTNATATPLRDPYQAFANSIQLEDDECIAVSALICATQNGATAHYAAYNVEFCARRQTGAGTTAIVGTTAVRAQESNTAWNITVTADTTNGGININAVGVASTTIEWSATVHVMRRKRVT